MFCLAAITNTQSTSSPTQDLFALCKKSFTEGWAIDFALKAGAEVNTTDNQGHTPLQWAARHSSPVVISLLLDAGAEATAKNSEGEMAIDFAKSNVFLWRTNEYWLLNDASFE